MRQVPGSKNLKNQTLNQIIFCILLLLTIIQTKVSKITEYPNSDDLFDKIYVLQSGTSTHYMRIYCKQKNMISLSITQQIQFEEYPRFPVNSPEHEVPRMQRKIYTFLESCGVKVVIQEGDSLVKIKRAGTSQTIFTINDYIFKQGGDIQIITEDLSTKWGLGERFQTSFAVKDGTWTVWNRDRPWQIDRGSPQRSAQTYGHQPVYLARETVTGKFHLVYFKNTYGFNFQSTQMSKRLKYIVTGGHIHFVILTGQNPQSILKQYHQYIGVAHVPPFWSLGYHQSRWGYRNYNQFSKVVDEFERLELPLDTMWSDLDYMDKKAIFTVDTSNYPPAKMSALIKNKRINYIPLIDVGVSLLDLPANNLGTTMDVFFKSVNNPNQEYVGAVWPGRVHFVDYLHPNSSNYWQSQLDRLYQLIPFSGIWLDMNQPSNFQGNEHVVQGYRIQHSQSINMMTIDVNLNHYCKSCGFLKHKQVHAYYGHLSTVPTYQYLKRKTGRPFIISRSNSVGTGVYAGHWTGDNVATWQFLRLSISGNFLFQIFGIQMVGADICGFHQNTNQQLCSRWMQVGSFYPFARNHNQNQSTSQQPYQFGNRLLQTTKLSFYQRYSLLKQMYTTMVDINGTGSFYRPIFFQFPNDIQSYIENYVQTQFMIGDYLMSAPIVEQSRVQRQVYFPKGNDEQTWYQLQFNKNTGVTINQQPKFYKGQTIQRITNQLPSPPPIYLRSGRMILTNKPATRTLDLTNKFTLVAALKNGRSTGKILAARNYSSNQQIDQCVLYGCTMQLTVSRSADGTLVLDWKRTGTAKLQISIQIQNIKIVDQDKVLMPINKIQINSPQGRQVLNIP